MRNEDFYLSTETSFLQTNRIVKKIKIAFAIVLLMFSISNVFSQVDKQKNNPKNDSEAIETQRIYEVQNYIQLLKLNEVTNNLSYSSSDRLKELLYKPQTSIYYYSGVTKVFGENVTNLYTDVTSLETFDFTEKYNNVEIITIYINTSNELNGRIDLNLFKDLKKLKYVYIVGKAAVNEAQIVKMIRNLDSNYGVFYMIPRDDNY